MIFGKNTVNHPVEILNKKASTSKSKALLEVTIDDKLNCDIHINNMQSS